MVFDLAFTVVDPALKPAGRVAYSTLVPGFSAAGAPKSLVQRRVDNITSIASTTR